MCNTCNNGLLFRIYILQDNSIEKEDATENK